MALYVGYYLEDPGNNPEDPTAGTVFLSIPSGNGSFSGQMPFSYVGCGNSASVAAVTGTRSANALTGNFSGSSDGVALAGNFSGTLDTVSGTFSGTYTNSAGKVRVSVGNRSYFVAAFGTWKVYPGLASDPQSFVVSATPGGSPTFSWSPLAGASLYSIRVFDENCLQTAVTSIACYRVEAFTNGTSSSFPANFSRATSLSAGTPYLVTTVAQAAGAQVVGFTSVRVRP